MPYNRFPILQFPLIRDEPPQFPLLINIPRKVLFGKLLNLSD